MGDYTTQLNVDYKFHHYKDPYEKTTRKPWKVIWSFRGSCLAAVIRATRWKTPHLFDPIRVYEKIWLLAQVDPFGLGRGTLLQHRLPLVAIPDTLQKIGRSEWRPWRFEWNVFWSVDAPITCSGSKRGICTLKSTDRWCMTVRSSPAVFFE